MKYCLYIVCLLVFLMPGAPSMAQDGASDAVITSDNVQSLSAVAEVYGQPGLFDLAFTPDGAVLVSGGVGLTAWTMETGEVRFSVPPGGDEPGSELYGDLEFSPDGTVLAASFHPDFRLRFIDPTSGDTLSEHPLPGEFHNNVPSDVAFSPDGSLLAWGGDSCTPYLWEVNSGTVIGDMRAPDASYASVEDVQFSPDGTGLAVACGIGVDVFDVAEQQYTRSLGLWGARVLAFAPDGTSVAFSGDPGDPVDVWDWQTGEAVASLPIGQAPVTSIAFSPAGDLLAASSDTTVQLWDTNTWTPVVTLNEHEVPVSTVNFSPDGALFLTASYDGRVIFHSVSPQVTLPFGPMPEPTPVPPTPTPAPTSEAVSEPEQPAETGVAPRSGHWEGTDPSISFDISEDGKIVIFAASVPYATGHCSVEIASDVGTASPDGVFTVELADTDGDDMFVGNFDGVFVTDSTLEGTYSVLLCGGTMSFVDSDKTWSAGWVGE